MSVKVGRSEMSVFLIASFFQRGEKKHFPAVFLTIEGERGEKGAGRRGFKRIRGKYGWVVSDKRPTAQTAAATTVLAAAAASAVQVAVGATGGEFR
jgi:hypothetical protein